MTGPRIDDAATIEQGRAGREAARAKTGRDPVGAASTGKAG